MSDNYFSLKPQIFIQNSCSHLIPMIVYWQILNHFGKHVSNDVLAYLFMKTVIHRQMTNQHEGFYFVSQPTGKSRYVAQAVDDGI